MSSVLVSVILLVSIGSLWTFQIIDLNVQKCCRNNTKLTIEFNRIYCQNIENQLDEFNCFDPAGNHYGPGDYHEEHLNEMEINGLERNTNEFIDTLCIDFLGNKHVTHICWLKKKHFMDKYIYKVHYGRILSEAYPENEFMYYIRQIYDLEIINIFATVWQFLAITKSFQKDYKLINILMNILFCQIMYYIYVTVSYSINYSDSIIVLSNYAMYYWCMSTLLWNVLLSFYYFIKIKNIPKRYLYSIKLYYCFAYGVATFLALALTIIEPNAFAENFTTNELVFGNWSTMFLFYVLPMHVMQLWNTTIYIHVMYTFLNEEKNRKTISSIVLLSSFFLIFSWNSFSEYRITYLYNQSIISSNKIQGLLIAFAIYVHQLDWNCCKKPISVQPDFKLDVAAFESLKETYI